MAKIMIVDDDPDIIKLNQYLLKSAGFETCAAENGQQALEVAREEKPDLVLMDMYMPGMDGVEVIQKLQKQRPGENIPFIIISGVAGDMDYLKTVLSGWISYMEKPFSPKDLIQQVKLQLGRT